MSNTTSDKLTVRETIHQVIFGVRTPAGFAFDVVLLVVILLSVTSNSLETVGWIRFRWHDELMVAKWIFTILFTIEYFLRIYCVQRPFRYIFSFWGVIDLLAILPDYLLLLFGGANSNAFSAIRSLRLLRVFRIMNLSWFQHEGEDLRNAIWRARGKIVVFLMVVMVIVTVAGTVMYEIEQAFAPMVQDPAGADGELISSSDFTSIPNGVYWAIVTMTTVGFGDIVPLTTGGKIISAILILVGYSLIIVPTGFVSAEVLGARKRLAKTRTCAACVTDDHDDDAKFCKHCGEAFN